MFADPITVYRALNIADAELVRARLEAAGFMASVSHELAALSMEGYAQSTGGVRVEVPGDEAEDAREFLAAPPESSQSDS
ncbi:MAG: DUF2007 domain-containing protein [Verrucomicrobiota bacterium]